MDRLTTIEVMLRGALESRDDHEVRIRALEQAAATREKVEKLEGRIRGMENFRWKLAGGIAVIGSVVGGLAGAIATAFIGG